ncbi:hypothetical protein [Catenulispora sp. GP43]|uniref:hypothetical protein n=1 Tax=Catenulispora sp. GP43 TaxID=3156263 RepID=UPI003511FCE5
MGHIISATTATVALVAGLAGCSSSGSKAASQPGAPATTATSAQAANPTTTAATATGTTGATGSTDGQTIAAVLAAFGPGPITGAHQPTADAAWVARVQKNKTPAPQASDPKMLNLMALVDEAAREKDTNSLDRLCSDVCDPKVQAPLWQKPGVLDGLTLLIEQGPLWGEGAALPDFLAAKSATSFTNAPDSAFGKAAGVDSPAAYFKKYPYWTAFQNGSGGANLQVEWAGISAQALGG